jgi:hypothetical protein
MCLAEEENKFFFLFFFLETLLPMAGYLDCSQALETQRRRTSLIKLCI